VQLKEKKMIWLPEKRVFIISYLLLFCYCCPLFWREVCASEKSTEVPYGFLQGISILSTSQRHYVQT